MKNWFADAFDDHYLKVYSHRSEGEAHAMVAWLVAEFGLHAHALVLDAPCGAGRHSRAFARHGMRVVGIDLSSALLAAARQQSQPDSGISWLRADLRHLPFLSGHFDICANIFSSFGYFFDERENEAVIAEFSRVLRPGGWLVLDFMNAPYVRNTLVPFSERQAEDGWEILEWRAIRGTPLRVEKRTLIRLPNGAEREIFESVRLYEPSELVAMVDRAHLGNVALFGDYTGSPWSEATPRCIIIGRKAD
jgi:SAM-dependent methyltransferase